MYKNSKEGLYTIRIHKLHQKHISSNSQYVEILSKKHPDKTKKVINIFLGTADKLNRLIDLGAIDVGTKYTRSVILDGQISDTKENTTIFDIP